MAIKVQGITVIDDGRNIINGIGASFTGIVTATTFSGSGANLTSIPNSGLSNSSVNYGGVSLALGASDATPAFDLSDATNYPTSSLSGTITNDQLAGSIADGKLASTFLKNVVEDTTPQLGGNLDFNSKFITGTGGINVTGVVTTTKLHVGVDTGFYNEDLVVTGDTRITGILTIGTASITLDPNAKTLTGLDELQIGSGNTAITIKKNSTTGDITFEDISGKEASVGIGTTVSIKTTGIITATTFSGSGTNLTGLTGASAATYGDASNVAQIVVDANGRITGISEVTISGGGGINGITVREEGSVVGTSNSVRDINIVGDNLTATASGVGATITFTSTPTFTSAVVGSGVTINSSGINATGVVTATTFSGSGASLTNIANGALTNSSIAIGGVTLNLGDTDATPAFNLSDATAYPYTSLTGITTEIVGDTTPQLGGNLDINSKFITGTGGINVTGVVTATTFDGNVTGNITGDVSGNAGTATSLSSARNFSITGDVVASAVSFDGTGNVVLSTAIQPNSVALATDTTGDFVQSITGTTNEVTVSATSGENSTPQIGLPNDVTIGQDLTVTRNIDVDGHTELDDVNVSGALTATSLNVTDKLTTTGIGISIANGAGNTAYIEGPSEIWIDPHPFGVGQTSGSVRIRGDLYVDGTEFIVDVDKIELGDFNIGIASTVSTNSLLDGAGLGIGATSIRKFITWNNATSALMSSENWNLASGKHYEIDGTDVLTSDTLGSGVINSSLTSVGTLGALTVSGNVNANGNIIGDGATNISGINSVTATLFYGSGANLTSIPNGALTNSSIAIGGVTLNLGDTDATPAFNLSDATAYPTSSLVGTITNAQLAGSIADDKLASTFLKNVVEDTTPQLGGNLDFNSKFITGTGGINVTGVVTATTFSGNLPTSDLTGTITNAQLAGSIANAKLVNDSVSFGGVSVDLGASDATPAFDLSDATAYPTSSLVGTITNAQLAGSIADDKLASTFLKNVVEDTTPQLGGNLDFNSKFITGTGGINVTGVVTATSFVGSSAVVGSGVTINSNGLNITGVVTATSFTGSGSALTGLTGASAATYGDASNVAQIVVNSDGKITGISEVTISGGGGSSGISSVGIQSGGTPVGAGATLMNFVGTGITMSATEGLIDIHIPVATRTTTRTVATNAQTTFSATYTVGYVDVYLNGSKLDINEFTATNGTSVVLGTGASTDDIVEIVAQNVTAAVDLNGLANVVDDTSPQLGGNLDINDKFITGTGGINVTGVVTATSFVGSSAVVGSGVTINSNGLNITGVVTATSFVGNVTGNADTATSATTATTATTATNTTVADESSDTSCFPLFVTAATGDLPPKSGSNLTFDSSAGILGATTFAGNVDLSGLLKEGVNITAGKLSANTNIDLANGMVHLFTTTETTTATPNIRVDGSTSLNASMSIGEAITVVVIITAAAAGYSAQLTIDSGPATEEWLGGSAPSTGGSGGYDVYTYNIIKTADATFVVLANLVNFA